MDSIVQKIVGKDVKVEEINKFLQTQGVVVKLSVGGGRNSYYVSPKIYGIVEENLSEDSTEFVTKHMKDGKISLLSKEDPRGKKLRGIESRVRKKLREIAVGYNDSFVPMSSFSDFKDYFEENAREFFEVRDELCESYEFLKQRFINIARKALVDLNAQNAERELEDVISRLPSKERFRQSFYMNMDVSAFPTTENLNMFSDDVRDAIQQGMSRSEGDLIMESIIASLNEGFTVLMSVIRSYNDNGTLHSRVLLGLKNGVQRMGQKNIAGNPKIEFLREEISSLVSKDSDDAAGTAEYLLAEIYNYAIELGVEESLSLEKSPYTREEIEDIAASYK